MASPRVDAAGGGPAKVCSLDELRRVADELRARDETIVLAHGAFDLLHIGHVHHLRAARKNGTVLMVTVTADKHVIKGPGRPVFSEALRAEMVASLECVDWVAVHDGPSAEEAIEAIKPHVYVKGSEYADPDQDITGKIDDERAAVEAHGGRLAFTDEATYSSSSLINRYLDIYDAPLRDYLNSLRLRNVGEELLEAIRRVEDKRVLVVGDAIIDEYVYVRSLGKSPKEDMIATLHSDSEMFAGGVFAAANHAASLCAEVELITVLGAADPHEDLIRASLKPNVRFTPIYRPGAPTTKKTRFVHPTYFRKLFEVYTMDDAEIGGELESALVSRISQQAPDYDLTIVTDFGHGMITGRAVEALERHARFLAVNTQANSANFGYNLITKFARADYICVDAPEARLAAGDKSGEIESAVIERIREQVRCEHHIITHGDHGCIAFEPNGGVYHIPAFTKTVVDTLGAGDAFFAVTAPLVAAGVPMEIAGVIGNAAGAMMVSVVGHRKSIEKTPLIKYLETLLK